MLSVKQYFVILQSCYCFLENGFLLFHASTISNRWGLSTLNQTQTKRLHYFHSNFVFVIQSLQWFRYLSEVKSVISSTTEINSCINAGVSAFSFYWLFHHNLLGHKKKSLISQNSDTKCARSLIKETILVTLDSSISNLFQSNRGEGFS
jgi:hypothetical protein